MSPAVHPLTHLPEPALDAARGFEALERALREHPIVALVAETLEALDDALVAPILEAARAAARPAPLGRHLSRDIGA